MANIKLNNNEYPIPDSALAGPRADFVAHLGTIAGSGMKVVVGGVEYGIDSSKVSGSISNFEEFLDVLVNGPKLAPGLYETGAIAKLNEGKEDEAASMLKTSWTDLVSSGVIVVENGAVSVGYFLPDNLPAQNEYGFYFGVKYAAFGQGFVFYEDGSVDFYGGDELQGSYPADCAIYSDNTIDLSSMDLGVWTVYSDRKITNDELGITLSLGDQAKIEGDLIMPNDIEITALSKGAFSNQASLTGIALPDGWSSISRGAFAHCSSLANVKLPNELTDIGDFAFQCCSSLESIMIPKSVTHIGEAAFGECTSLTDVTFEEGIQLETLGGINLFMFSGITSIEIPSSVKYIEAGVFKRCDNLTSINFAGTMSQWDNISKGDSWDYYIPASYVYCSDGRVSLK